MKFNISNNIRGKVYRLTFKNKSYLELEPHEVLNDWMFTYVKDGWCYDLIFKFKKIFLFGWLSMKVQEYLRKRKIYWHDPIMGQCTRYMECCEHKVSEDMKGFFKSLTRASAEGIPVLYHNKGDKDGKKN